MTNIISITLIIIAVAQVWRVWQLVRPETKKRHFKMKLAGTEKMIYDLEFKVYKTKEIREQIREEYDFMCSRIHGYEEQLKGKLDKEDKKVVENTLEKAKTDRDRLKAQVEHLDIEINGTTPNERYPDGVTGTYQQIDSLRELTGMLKSWIKNV